ncbi:MAG: DUF4224 domain-containing protein [Gammaproteobacteria bacterium]|nr:DUF4224 domain-containing protein [Gammaproteobacteria bacterium]
MSAAEQLPDILEQDQLIRLTGYTRAADIERVLREQGIEPFYGRGGRLFVLREQFLAARGIIKTALLDEEPLL